MLWRKLLPPMMGIGLLVLIWELVALRSAGSFPSPIETFKQAIDVFSDPFYSKGPNDQGVGWNVLSSLNAWPWALAWQRWSAFRPAS